MGYIRLRTPCNPCSLVIPCALRIVAGLDKNAVICYAPITHETLEISDPDSLCDYDWLAPESATLVIPPLDYIGSRALKSPVYRAFFLPKRLWQRTPRKHLPALNFTRN